MATTTANSGIPEPRPTYKDAYRGVPAEIRLKIWQYMIPEYTTIASIKIDPEATTVVMRAVTEGGPKHIWRTGPQKPVKFQAVFSPSLSLQFLQLNKTIREESKHLFTQKATTFDLTQLAKEDIKWFMKGIIDTNFGYQMMGGIKVPAVLPIESDDSAWASYMIKVLYITIVELRKSPKPALNKLILVIDTARWTKEYDALRREYAGKEEKDAANTLRKCWDKDSMNASYFTRLLAQQAVREIVLRLDGCNELQANVTKKLVECHSWDDECHGLDLDRDCKIAGHLYNVTITAARGSGKGELCPSCGEEVERSS